MATAIYGIYGFENLKLQGYNVSKNLTLLFESVIFFCHKCMLYINTGKKF